MGQVVSVMAEMVGMATFITIGRVSQFIEVHGGISGGENHADIGWESLQEQFA